MALEEVNLSLKYLADEDWDDPEEEEDDDWDDNDEEE